MLPLTDDVLTNAQNDINTHDLNSEFDEEYDEVNSSTFVAQMLTKKYISYFRVFFYCHNSRRFFTSGFYFWYSHKNCLLILRKSKLPFFIAVLRRTDSRRGINQCFNTGSQLENISASIPDSNKLFSNRIRQHQRVLFSKEMSRLSSTQWPGLVQRCSLSC